MYSDFMTNKVNRQIQRVGKSYDFVHTVPDKYHEGTGETVTNTVKGVYHQSTSYASKTSSEGAVISSKPSPMILCLYTDGSKVSKGDTMKSDNQGYRVTGLEDVQQLHLVMQLSLEVIQNE